MTVGELELRMSASELAEWVSFYQMEPFGVQRDNIHAGLIASTIANVHRKKNAKPLSFEHFMLVDATESRKRKSKETLAAMKALAKKEPKRG
jgi:chemotaxis receptor (MCP) glutamine deamidase CheD